MISGRWFVQPDKFGAVVLDERARAAAARAATTRVNDIARPTNFLVHGCSSDQSPAATRVRRWRQPDIPARSACWTAERTWTGARPAAPPGHRPPSCPASRCGQESRASNRTRLHNFPAGRKVCRRRTCQAWNCSRHARGALVRTQRARANTRRPPEQATRRASVSPGAGSQPCRAEPSATLRKR